MVMLAGTYRLDEGWPWLLALPVVIAVSALVVPLVNLLVTLTLPPRAVPRMDFATGIPDAHRSMVVVPTLLTDLQGVDDLLDAMEVRYLGNRDPNLFFALLTDFSDAQEQTLPGDAELVARARTAVAVLNETYRDDRPCIFFLFHRPRSWNAVERLWMGYERKRGKLQDFNGRLRGAAASAFSDIIGDTAVFASIRYVITLDTDTQLPRDTACRLVGNLAHPLNRPVFDAAQGRVVEGYAILQPRASISLTSAARSRFARLCAGESGLDPYTREVSDVYQDLFAEGSFVGKGIYDVDAFRLAVDGRFPENLILSHDLLEGGYARSALVSDVDLIEEHPPSITGEGSRRHRWVRGDWQLSGWLLPRVPSPPGAARNTAKRVPNPLTALNRWKLLDNLRRSLVAPALLLLLVLGWLRMADSAWLWTMLVLLVLCVPSLVSSLIELVRKPGEHPWLVHIAQTLRSTGRPLALALLALVLLPYDTRIGLGAILRSRGGMLFSRRGMLQWQLPGYARRNACAAPGEFCRDMWPGPLLALLLTVVLVMAGPTAAWPYAGPLLLLWWLSPLIGWWISRPLAERAPTLSPEQQTFLRLSARRTWRYFDDFVGADDNYLPPDNVQESPAAVIASRTSPTNMGMSLLADLAALDFGYVSTGQCLQRLGNSLAAMTQLERFRGHFYNWYDTRTLQPLAPRYLSSVDSGNLLGALLTLQAGLHELKHQPILSASAFQGLMDTLQILCTHLPAKAAAPLTDPVRQLEKILQPLLLGTPDMTLESAVNALDQLLHVVSALATLPSPAIDDNAELVYWVQAFQHQASALAEDVAWLLPDSRSGVGIPSLAELATAGANREAALRQLDLVDELIARCRELAVMDFDFLYRDDRGLLAIGFDVGERRLDPACYDLLASEARLASFLLIAQGQVPQKHWFSLGRLLTRHDGVVSLISWSGSMFEYLMPLLIMPSYPSTLLNQTCRAAVARQIEYGRQRQVPWGISESCYNATDINQVYQYRAFGVPGLGFKRGLGDDLVIAPYASALALTVMPQAACRNLQVLAGEGFMGAYGFYEAIDYTPSRLPPDKSHAIVRTFMVHHQGMSLLAFAHVLLDQPMQRRFMSDPILRATESLLQERVPRKGATLHPHAAEVTAAARPPSVDAGSIMRVFSTPHTRIPEVHLLSNGRYHVMVTQAGGG